MNEGKHMIPGANIGDTDLAAIARTNPTAAAEIARLEKRMRCGEETKEEFLRLCQLLFAVGSVEASEHLLRRGLNGYEGHRLYSRLFGTAKQEEFAAAIEAFKSQFDLDLALIAEEDFLVSRFHSAGGLKRSDAFSLLSRPCEITFGYIEQDRIEANVLLLDLEREVFNADEGMLLFFVNGVWELADPMES